MFSVSIEGFSEARKYLKSGKLKHALTEPMLSNAAVFCRKIQSNNAPIWKGRIDASLDIKYDSSVPHKEILIGHVDSEPEHAKFMEYGTGTQHLGENYTRRPNKPHVTRAKHVWGWSKSNGLNPYKVAGAITKRGGLKPRKYIRSGFIAIKDQAFWDNLSRSIKIEIEI